MQQPIVGGPPTATPEPPPEPGVVPDAQLEAQVKARRARREQAEAEAAAADDHRATQETLRKAANGKDLNEDEIATAIEHFLATEQDAEVRLEPKTLKLNLGSKDDPKWIRWEVAPIDDTEITRIRKESVRGTRAQRRRGDAETDEVLVSRKLVVRATVDPDPRELARTMGHPDPADAIHAFFRKYGKTGLITQISGEILSISGWDDEDIQEVDAARG